MPVSKLVAVRLPDDLLARIDAHAARLRQLTGLEPSRSMVIKSLVERGLAAFEAEAQPARKR
jgi:metal-responsive CopG/Arc/MetJ family transcriptional regulator